VSIVPVAKKFAKLSPDLGVASTTPAMPQVIVTVPINTQVVVFIDVKVIPFQNWTKVAWFFIIGQSPFHFCSSSFGSIRSTPFHLK
jgi:hypothetical protein